MNYTIYGSEESLYGDKWSSIKNHYIVVETFKAMNNFQENLFSIYNHLRLQFENHTQIFLLESSVLLVELHLFAYKRSVDKICANIPERTISFFKYTVENK